MGCACLHPRAADPARLIQPPGAREMGKVAGHVEGLGRHRADQHDLSPLPADCGDCQVKLGDEVGRVEVAICPEGDQIDAAYFRIGAQRGEGSAVGGGAARISAIIAQNRRAA